MVESVSKVGTVWNFCECMFGHVGSTLFKMNELESENSFGNSFVSEVGTV